jgi:SAM-dependent methyltransferase
MRKSPHKKLRVIRDHDRFYLKEDRKLKPKEYFKFINGHSEKFLGKILNPRILDVGCATGDFLHYISTLYPNAQLTGLDIMPELIRRAKKEVPNSAFFIADIFSGSNLPREKFDAIFLLGVHPIFDDYKPWLNNLLKLTKTNGRIYVFGIFNPENTDVLVKVRYSNDGNKPWQAGWNVFSKKTIGSYLEKIKARYKFYDFTISIDLPRHKDDPLRSWTFKLQNGQRALINGTQIVHRLSLLEIYTQK